MVVMNEKAKQWLANKRDRGMSSEAILGHMEGLDPAVFGINHPLDPVDLGRCIRLIDMAGYRPRLQELKALSPVWSVLIDNWNELEKLYYLGLASESRRAPECYELMKELINQAQTATTDHKGQIKWTLLNTSEN
jgi:hypothetical protein